jgi:hypothetical protein
VYSENQDVEALLGQVSEQLTQWEGGRTPELDLSLMLGETGRAAQRAARLKGQWNVNSWAIVQSTRPRWGPLIIRFQHLVRRLTWWYLEPIIIQIRGFQMNAAYAVDDLARNQESLLAALRSQSAEINALQQRLLEVESRRPVVAEETREGDSAG